MGKGKNLRDFKKTHAPTYKGQPKGGSDKLPDNPKKMLVWISRGKPVTIPKGALPELPWSNRYMGCPAFVVHNDHISWCQGGSRIDHRGDHWSIEEGTKECPVIPVPRSHA